MWDSTKAAGVVHRLIVRDREAARQHGLQAPLVGEHVALLRRGGTRVDVFAVETGALLDRVRQRIFETAQFLFDVLDEESLGEKGRGVRSAQRVRLMHAAIRRLVHHQHIQVQRQDFNGKVLTIRGSDLAMLAMLLSELQGDEVGS